MGRTMKERQCTEFGAPPMHRSGGLAPIDGVSGFLEMVRPWPLPLVRARSSFFPFSSSTIFIFINTVFLGRYYVSVEKGAMIVIFMIHFF